MATPQLMNQVEDGIIRGWVEMKRKDCQICGHATKCIGVIEVSLPEGLKKTDSNVLFNRLNADFYPDRGPYIGIGCGCYAKGHRQVAHITSAIKTRENARRAASKRR